MELSCACRFKHQSSRSCCFDDCVRNLNEFVFTCVVSQDARDGLLGRLFAYGSLVRAKRLIVNGTSLEEKELAKEIVEQLLTLAKQKTFLRESAVNLVIELASRVCIFIHCVYFIKPYWYCFQVYVAIF